MSNRVYECFLKTGLPKRPDGKSYSPTAYNIYRTLCYRYDENKGYAYPGEIQLVLASGVSRQSVNRALTELKDGGVLIQKSKGYKNQRAEFVPDYHLKKADESVNPALHNYKLNETSSAGESDRLEISKGKENPINGTGLLDSISTLSSSKSSKEKNYYLEALSFIPAPKRFHLTSETIKLLENLEHKGTTLKAIKGDFSEAKWHLIDNPKAFVESRLKALLARPTHFDYEHQPPKNEVCPCDEKTRRLPSPVFVQDGNGAQTLDCPKHHYTWVNKKNGY